MHELMTTREVAEYLRLKERKIYELVAEGRIPCSRVTGKWLFPRTLIDLWVLQNTDYPGIRPSLPPPVLAGSHDPLLEWAVRESGCGLALLFDGSLDGLRRLAARQALACGLHVYEPEQERYNLGVIAAYLPAQPVVALEWAWREQGVLLAAGNPLGVTSLADLAARRVRVIGRQAESGSQLLLEHLLQRQGLSWSELDSGQPVARSESEVALAVLEGRAEAGLAIRAVARQFRLEFLPLQRERYDLVMGRRDYFEEPLQRLLQFARSARFAERAAELGGYDVSALGRVVYNGP
ncbi:MAG TPA: helix-turn-helix transcriptional regulator [Candidatus Competibacteraceae bacterium]|nr:helix-turn-helix transcriptional regulator [Candidatus Competibacteraceae bacterium]